MTSYSYENYVLTVTGTGALEIISGYDDTKKIYVIGFTTIQDSAFINCRQLEELILSETVTTLGNSILYCTKVRELHLPNSVRYLSTAQPFDQCDYFERFTVSNDNEMFSVKNDVLYSKDMKTLYSYPGGKKDKIYCVPDGVVDIWHDAIAQNPYLEELILPASVQRAFNSFCYRSTVKSIIIFRCNGDSDNLTWEGGDPFVSSSNRGVEVVYSSYFSTVW